MLGVWLPAPLPTSRAPPGRHQGAALCGRLPLVEVERFRCWTLRYLCWPDPGTIRVWKATSADVCVCVCGCTRVNECVSAGRRVGRHVQQSLEARTRNGNAQRPQRPHRQHRKGAQRQPPHTQSDTPPQQNERCWSTDCRLCGSQETSWRRTKNLLAGGVPLRAVSPRVVFPPAVFGGCPPPVLLSRVAA